MTRVTWKSLRLSGFGPFRDPVTINLSSGLNVLVAANESGKSSLVTGLAATLFGLRSSSDPTAFGTARFRHRSQPDRFEGQIDFQSDSTHYRLHRNFDNHRIQLVKQTENGWDESVGGTHNPRATKPNVTFEQKLQALLGLGSRQLFTNTFCVVQPLPAQQQLTDELQQLLSGSGRSFQNALDQLIEELRTITRFGGDRGVKSRNDQKDRRLEQVKHQIEQLENEIEESRSTARRLNQTREALQNTVADLDQTSSQRVQAQDSLNAWTDWRRLYSQYQQNLDRQTNLQQSLRKARQHQTTLDELETQLQKAFPGLVDQPQETGEQLEQLQTIENRLSELREKLKELEQEREAALEQIQSIEQRLDQTFADVNGRPHLRENHSKLLYLTGEKQALREQLKAVTTKQTEAARALDQLPPWGRFDSNPVTVLRSLEPTFNQLLSDWQQAQTDREQLRAIEQTMTRDYDLFETASEETLERLASLPGQRQQCEHRCSQANQRLKQLQERRKTFREQQQAFKDSVGELPELEPDTVAAVEQKLDLLDRYESLDSELGPLPAAVRWGVPSGLALLSGLMPLLFPQVNLDLNLPALAAVLTAAAGAVVGSTAINLWHHQTRRHQLGPVEHQMERLDEQLGSLAGYSPLKLAQIRERLHYRQAAVTELEALRQDTPSQESVEAARAELKAAEEALQTFEASIAPFSQRYGNDESILSALESWKQLRQQRTGLRERLEKLDAGEDTHQYKRLSALASVVCLYEGSSVPQTQAALMNWFESWHSQYKDAIDQAADWEHWNEQRIQANHKEKELQQDLATLEENIDRMKAKTEPFDETVSAETLVERIQACEELKREHERYQNQIDRIEKEQNQLRPAIKPLEAQAAALKQETAAVLADSGDDLTHALERWHEYTDLHSQYKQVKQTLDSILEAQDTDSLAALEKRHTAAQTETLTVRSELQALIEQHPALPQPGEVESHEAFEQHYHTLEENAAALQSKEQSLQNEVQRLNRQLARLEGKEPLNIAAASDRLDRLRQQEQRLRLEADAVTTAHNLLKQAVDDFQLTYRNRLAAAVSEYFQSLSTVEERRVTLDDQFRLRLHDHRGRPFVVEQLSQGAQDQLYLSLRLAVADFIAGDVTLPFIFDDPFLNCDQERLQQIRRTLERLAENRQVWVLSHRDEFNDWGTKVELKPS